MSTKRFNFRKSSIQLKKFPESYQSNTEKEEYMLSCCENFRRQYKHLYRDRKPLFLTPKNECGIEVELYICDNNITLGLIIIINYQIKSVQAHQKGFKLLKKI